MCQIWQTRCRGLISSWHFKNHPLPIGSLLSRHTHIQSRGRTYACWGVLKSPPQKGCAQKRHSHLQACRITQVCGGTGTGFQMQLGEAPKSEVFWLPALRYHHEGSAKTIMQQTYGYLDRSDNLPCKFSLQHIFTFPVRSLEDPEVEGASTDEAGKSHKRVAALGALHKRSK